MVSEQNIEQILNNTTSDENHTEETTTSFSVVIATAVDARINAAMDEWFRHLQKMLGTKYSRSYRRSRWQKPPTRHPRAAARSSRVAVGATRAGPLCLDVVGQPNRATLVSIRCL